MRAAASHRGRRFGTRSLARGETEKYCGVSGNQLASEPARTGRAFGEACCQENVTVPTTEEIQEKVVTIVAEQLSVDKAEISRETSFVNDLGADSLDTVELVMELEDEFDMSIPDEEAEKLQTVGAAIDYIQKMMAASSK